MHPPPKDVDAAGNLWSERIAECGYMFKMLLCKFSYCFIAIENYM
jgi:hypothetical protein